MQRYISHIPLTRLLLICSTLVAMPALAYLGPGGGSFEYRSTSSADRRGAACCYRLCLVSAQAYALG